MSYYWAIEEMDGPLAEPPFADSRVVADNASSIHDFPLISPVSNPYTTQSAIEARLGGALSLIEGTDDDSTGSLNSTVLNNLIQAITDEINGHLGVAYPIPFRRRGTVAIVAVTNVDSNGVITEIDNPPFTESWPHLCNGWKSLGPRPNGYYQIAPTPISGSIYATTGGTGTGATLSLAFNASPDPFSVAGLASISSGGTGYTIGDIIGLTGGASYVPDKVKTCALVLCCHAIYARRLSPDEKNIFDTEAKFWRGSANAEGQLPKMARGEIALAADYARSFSPGAAIVERVRLNSNSL